MIQVTCESIEELSEVLAVFDFKGYTWETGTSLLDTTTFESIVRVSFDIELKPLVSFNKSDKRSHWGLSL